MIFFDATLNIDLLAIGVTVAAIGILGFVAFFSNPRSSTSRSFLTLALVTIAYSTVNYISYQLTDANVILWVLRLTIFFAVWHAFSFFHFSYVFPKESMTYPEWYKWLLIPVVAIVSLLTLSPLIFTRLEVQAGAGSASQAVLGPAISLFALTTFGLVVAALFLLIKRTIKAQGLEKKQFLFILGGAALTFALLITFNLILPIVFQEVRYIPLAALFFFPFIAFTTYAILKHHLLSAKVVSTEILAFILAVVTLSEVIISQSLVETLFRSGEFILVLIFGIFLIKSVLKEVEQREELERLNKQIEAQNAQLQELSHFKSELLSLASHQIKSPLAAIKGFASLIADGSYGEVGDKVKETVGKIQHSADDLIGLINTLLDVRKVEEGKMEYKFERTDLNKMVGGIMELLKPLADAKKLEFSFISPGHEIWVNADPEKLKQVVQNLTDNSIKYTPSGFVKVELKETPPAPGAATAGTIGVATLSVSDSGLGVAPDLIPHLFEEFVRDERVKKEIRGTGLGLYIARKIAEAHGGKIWAESEGEGKGSKFSVSVPEVK
jgi:signal transduction histidine kinase